MTSSRQVYWGPHLTEVFIWRLLLLPHTSEWNLTTRKGPVKMHHLPAPGNNSISCFQGMNCQSFVSRLNLEKNLLAELFSLQGKKKKSRKVLSQEVKETEISCATKHRVLVYVSEGNGEVAPMYLKKIVGERHVSFQYLTFSLLNLHSRELCVPWLISLQLGDTASNFFLLIRAGQSEEVHCKLGSFISTMITAIKEWCQLFILYTLTILPSTCISKERVI